MAVVRGVRNRNFGNIEYGAFAKLYGATGSDGRFAIFPDNVAGLRALAELLIVYSTKPDGRGGRIDTVREVITRWCEPPIDAYIAFACAMLDCKPDDEFDLSYEWLWWMTYAIGEHECGPKAFNEAVTDAQLDEAIIRALAP